MEVHANGQTHGRTHGRTLPSAFSLASRSIKNLCWDYCTYGRVWILFAFNMATWRVAIATTEVKGKLILVMDRGRDSLVHYGFIWEYNVSKASCMAVTSICNSIPVDMAHESVLWVAIYYLIFNFMSKSETFANPRIPNRTTIISHKCNPRLPYEWSFSNVTDMGLSTNIAPWMKININRYASNQDKSVSDL